MTMTQANPNLLNDVQATRGDFETDLSPLLSGTIAAIVSEADGERPASIIDANEKWYVDVAWQLSGKLVPLICGQWCVRLFLENIGPGGDDLEFGNDEGLIPLNPCGDGLYRAHFSIPANAVSVENCSTPYEAVVSVTYLTNCRIKSANGHDRHDNFKPGPVAGFVTFKTMQFFYEGVEI